MDRQTSYSISVLPSRDEENATKRVRSELINFILEFRIDNSFIYRDQLRDNVLIKQYYCDIDIAHLIQYSEELSQHLINEPAEIIQIFESALRLCSQKILHPGEPDVVLPDHQLLLHSSASEILIRHLDASHVSRLVRVPGIIIGSSTPSSKATILCIQCRNCQHTMTINITSGFANVSLPRTCMRVRVANETSEKCPLDPYFVVHERCQFIDQQTLKLQEAPGQVPVGELPRHILISAERYLASRVAPGTYCTITGIYSIYQSKHKKNSQSAGGAVAIRNPYLRAVGIQTDSQSALSGSVIFSESEEQEFIELSRREDIYDLFTRSIAPSIYGNDDIKRAIACLLLGGSKKLLPDGMRLRGDINVLLLGDPGTAKSQLLKFVEKCAPIAIYTSGKGSSSAGLTASVQREASTREFYLEGGAMVLADGGVVCIDEFDKMRDEDRVAIHEAMEQQTISIAKAGITTVLNARTSVLAAANPVFGRYDDLRSPADNIDFQTTILSRFDMIFIVRDTHDKAKDQIMAKHVMGIHMGRPVTDNSNTTNSSHKTKAVIPVEKLKRYISYCKHKCAPQLTASAAEKLCSHFVSIRRQVASREAIGGHRAAIPITVRQLEAVIRISESLAKLQLSNVADDEHVDEAMRLFLASTMNAVAAEADDTGGGIEYLAAIQNQTNDTNTGMEKTNSAFSSTNKPNLGASINAQAAQIEMELLKRLPVGWSTSLSKLRAEFVSSKGYSEAALARSLRILARRDTIVWRHAGTQIYRLGQ